MQKRTKNLLITLADKNYVEQAKQLFSSVYWNAGWDGDYMLLSQGIPEKELVWFKNKGILIYECKPLYNKKVGQGKIKYPPAVLTKFYIFKEYFKQWERVVFLDSDMIVRYSLEELKKAKGFSSVGLNITKDHLGEFIKYSEKHLSKIKKLKKNYDLDKEIFNTGVMSFETKVIKKDTFNKLTAMFEEYKDVTQGDDPIINLMFYDKWTKLHKMYNILARNNEAFTFIKKSPEKIQGVILHFSSRNPKDKPWDKKNYFYKEWSGNLKRAKLINLNKTQRPKEADIKKIENYLFDLKLKIILHFKKIKASEKNKEYVHKWHSW